jgi:hypothetical protein
MSNPASAQIKTLSTAIADIYLPSDEEGQGPRAIGDILRPFMIAVRRSRLSGEPLPQDILDRFCTPPSKLGAEQ